MIEVVVMVELGLGGAEELGLGGGPELGRGGAAELVKKERPS